MFLLYFYGLKLWSESLCRVLRLSFLEYAHYFVDSQKHKNERIEEHSLSWFVGSTYGDGTNHGHIRYMVQVQVYLVMASRDLNIRDIKKTVPVVKYCYFVFWLFLFWLCIWTFTSIVSLKCNYYRHKYK